MKVRKGMPAAELARQVCELRASHPKATQAELGAQLGISRDLFGYYLRREETREKRRVRTPMKRGRKPRPPRTEHFVAMRQTATMAVREAFPHMRAAEIAAALGLTREQVKHYLLHGVKARRPAWADTLFAACRALDTTQPARAADLFHRFAIELAKNGEVAA